MLTFPAFDALLRKWRGSGRPSSNLRHLRIISSISRIWTLVNALSVMYAKSPTSGLYISSYLEATNIAVTPTSWSFLRDTGWILCGRTMVLHKRLEWQVFEVTHPLCPLPVGSDRGWQLWDTKSLAAAGTWNELESTSRWGEPACAHLSHSPACI